MSKTVWRFALKNGGDPRLWRVPCWVTDLGGKPSASCRAWGFQDSRAAVAPPPNPGSSAAKQSLSPAPPPRYSSRCRGRPPSRWPSTPVGPTHNVAERSAGGWRHPPLEGLGGGTPEKNPPNMKHLVSYNAVCRIKTAGDGLLGLGRHCLGSDVRAPALHNGTLTHRGGPGKWPKMGFFGHFGGSEIFSALCWPLERNFPPTFPLSSSSGPPHGGSTRIVLLRPGWGYPRSAKKLATGGWLYGIFFIFGIFLGHI